MRNTIAAEDGIGTFPGCDTHHVPSVASCFKYLKSILLYYTMKSSDTQQKSIFNHIQFHDEDDGKNGLGWVILLQKDGLYLQTALRVYCWRCQASNVHLPKVCRRLSTLIVRAFRRDPYRISLRRSVPRRWRASPPPGAALPQSAASPVRARARAAARSASLPARSPRRR